MKLPPSEKTELIIFGAAKNWESGQQNETILTALTPTIRKRLITGKSRVSIGENF